MQIVEETLDMGCSPGIFLVKAKLLRLLDTILVVRLSLWRMKTSADARL